MKIVSNLPEEIEDLILVNESIGRGELARIANITEQDARYYLRLYRERLGDSSPKTLGMQDILQEKLKRQAKYVKSLQKEIATEYILLDKIKEFSEELVLPKKIDKIECKNNKIDTSMISMWSDWHVSEIIDLEQMGGLNEYNFDIFCSRLWNFLKGIIRIVDMQRKSQDISTLYIDMLGDFVSGSIHSELRETNEFPILKTLVMVTHITSQAIAMLSRHFNNITITGIVGNHGRLSKKPQFKNKVLNNYDWLFYQMLNLELSKFVNAGLVKFNIPESSECVIIREGWATLLSHGDGVRCWQGIPWYGLQRDTANQQKFRKLKSVISKSDYLPEQSESLEGALVNSNIIRNVFGFDFRECGHFHDFCFFGSTLVNGALCGTNEFALNKLHVISKPQQAIYFLNRKYGIKGIESLECNDKGHNFKI